MNIIDYILEKCGLVRCRICNKWTQPSIMVGNICSFECYGEEKRNEENK